MLGSAYDLTSPSSQRCALNEWPLQDAKNKFSDVVSAALAGEPQLVTRRGRPAVVVLPADEYERLRRLDRADAPGPGRATCPNPAGRPGLRAHCRPCSASHWLVALKERGRPSLRSNQPSFQCDAMAQDSSSPRRYVRVHFADSQVPAAKIMLRRLSEQLHLHLGNAPPALRGEIPGRLGKRMSSAHYVSLSHLSSG